LEYGGLGRMQNGTAMCEINQLDKTSCYEKRLTGKKWINLTKRGPVSKTAKRVKH